MGSCGRRCAQMRVVTMMQLILCIFVLSSSFVSSQVSQWDEGKATTALVVSMAAFSSKDDLISWTCFWCQSTWLEKMKLVSPIWNNSPRIKGVVLHDDKTVYVGFGGSDSIHSWLSNLNIILQNYPHDPNSRVHSGFYSAWVSCRDEVKDAANQAIAACPKCTDVVFTGHSLGGAMAVLSALDLASIFKNKGFGVSVTTFGQPRLGNSDFAKYIQLQLPNLYRVVHLADMIPHLPPKWMGYVHSPNEIWEKMDRQYVVCSSTTGEDPRCSNSLSFYTPYDHKHYMGFSIIW